MKKFFLIAVALLGASVAADAQWQMRRSPNDTLQSTVILPGNKVVFQIYAPQAESVSVAGDLPWTSPVKFEKQENGVWKGRLEKIDDGFFRYNFVVDGVNVYDPKSKLAGETKALLEVQPTGDEFFAFKENVPHGAISQRYYYSKNLKETRRMHIWTPAGYEKSDKELPVLYLVHGGGDNDLSWPTVGAACNILDNLLAEGKMEPMLVVMPNGTIHTTSLEGEVPLFVEDLMSSIIPFVEENYKVKTGPANRAMAGLSMGGMETMETILEHHEAFDYYWILSAGWFPDQKEAFANYGKRLNAVAKGLKSHVKQLVFTQGGPEDIAYNNCKATLTLFDDAGLKYEFYEGPGGHTWFTWRRDLHQLAQRLFK